MSAGPTTFGKYYLTEKLATGGMAEIYLAKLLGPGGFEKLLIIKQIRPLFGSRPEFVELFVQEAKTLVSLSHGNIVPVYELGVLDGTYFIAMEYIDGPTLAELTEAAPRRGQEIAPAMAAYICSELLKGLDYAHRKASGVIHRDLSPRNVMLSRDGEVKIVDFGIAATVDDNLHAREAKDEQPVGSFPYMSPEQVQRQPLGTATDLFAAGILLWETLAGAKLFARDTPEETLRAVVEADIPAPSTLNPKVPAELDAICARALRRDPAARFASAGEFHTKLTRYLYTVEPTVTATALSALVARTCPPVPRSAKMSGDTPGPMGQTPPIGERTRPMQRRHPRGTTQTFATHVQFKKVLERATPLLGVDAIPELVETIEGRTAADADRAVAAAEEAAGAVDPDTPRSRAWIGLLVLAVAAGGIFGAMWLAGRGGSGTADAGAIAAVELDAAVTAVAIDAGVATGIVDAAPVVDARKVRRKPDAAPRPRGTGTLVVLAEPWGTVYVDGKQVGTASGKFEVAAGPHKVRVVARDGVTEKVFNVDVKAGKETKTPVARFTN